MTNLDQAEIKKVTTELEHQNSSSLPGLLQGTFEEDRIATLKAIQKQNELNRQADNSLPALNLEIATGFSGDDVLRLNIDRHNFKDAWTNGPLLYQDTLNFNTLTHSTPNDVVPASRRQIDVRTLTSKLEHGDASGTTNLLSGMAEEERVRVFQDVRKLNQQDLKSKSTQSTLEIEMTPDKTGDNYIYVRRVQPGAHDEFWGGALLYHDNLNLWSGQRTSEEYKDNR